MAATGLRFGLIRVGGCTLGIDVAAVREVIHCPAALAPLPGAAAELRGAIDVRGSVVPVLDPAPLLGLAAALPTPQRVILLLRLGTAERPLLLGLLLDGVGSIVAPARLHGLEPAVADSAPGLLTHAFALDDAPADAGLVAVLDPAALARLAGAPLVAEAREAGETGATAAAGPREPCLLFEVGGHGLAIAAALVETTVPQAQILGSELRGGLCLGVIHHHGQEIPVVDSLQLLGLGRSPAAALSDVLVLRLGAGRLALVLDLVRDIRHLAAQALLPLPFLGLRRPELFAGLLPPEQEAAPVLLLRSAALLAEPVLQALAGLSHPIPAARSHRRAELASPEAAEAAGQGPQTSYLTYRLDTELGTPLTQVREIMRLPPQRGAAASDAPGMLGLLLHRGQALPLVCLRTVLGQARPSADHADAMVLVVDDEGGGAVGWVVDGLTGIEPARWLREAPADADPRDLSLQALVEVGGGEQRRTLPVLELRRLSRACSAR